MSKMEIKRAYKTSKGVYFTKKEAKENRADIVCSDGRYDSWKEKEGIIEIWVLCDEDSLMTFVLNPID